MSLSEYRVLVANLPRPTQQQIDAFIAFVCDHRSWYKCLPLALPGVWFWFFLNPLVGVKIEETKECSIVAFPIRESDTNYSSSRWKSTQGCREAFGCLDYGTAADLTVQYLQDGMTEHHYYRTPIVSFVDGQPATLPTQVVEVGSCALTAVIHRATASPYRSSFWRKAKERSNWSWPKETGGEAMVEKLIRACEEIKSDTVSVQLKSDTDGDDTSRIQLRPRIISSTNREEWLDRGYVVHPRLKALLAPEKARQTASMRAAVDAMLRLVKPERRLKDDGDVSEHEP